MKTKRIFLFILIVLLNAIIFMFSGQDGVKSESLSDQVAIKVIDKYAEIKKQEYSKEQKKKFVKDSRTLVRKGAHFTIYFVLGLLVYLFVLCYDVKRPVILAIIVCAMLACFDEFHQLFSSGRTARFYDILIDSFGSLVGIYLVQIIDNIKMKKKVISKKSLKTQAI